MKNIKFALSRILYFVHIYRSIYSKFGFRKIYQNNFFSLHLRDYLKTISTFVFHLRTPFFFSLTLIRLFLWNF